MIEDLNKNVTIAQYNYLNLPQQINISTNGSNEMNYLYTANGQKLMKQTRIDFAVEQTVDYIGRFVYEVNIITIKDQDGKVMKHIDYHYAEEENE
jgi:hypothetical protein